MADEHGHSRRGLRLVPGGVRDKYRLGRVEVFVGPREHPPFSVEALVFEDDNYSVLSVDTNLREPVEHPIRIFTELHGTEPARLGDVIVKAGRPRRFLAVVHDLSRDPTCREEWVARALVNCLREVERLGLRRLGMPPLGGVHGKIAPERFVALLRQALERVPGCGLSHLWLVARPGRQAGLERLLELAERDSKPR